LSDSTENNHKDGINFTVNKSVPENASDSTVSDSDTERNGKKKKRFWQKLFRRKEKKEE
jgi:hypothetical protein